MRRAALLLLLALTSCGDGEPPGEHRFCCDEQTSCECADDDGDSTE